jgi:hypothetical protein
MKGYAKKPLKPPLKYDNMGDPSYKDSKIIPSDKVSPINAKVQIFLYVRRFLTSPTKIHPKQPKILANMMIIPLVLV